MVVTKTVHVKITKLVAFNMSLPSGLNKKFTQQATDTPFSFSTKVL